MYRNIYNFILYIPPFLLILLPISLVIGPFLSDLTVIIIAIYFLFNVNNEKYKFLIKNYYFILFTIFCLYLIFVSFISINKLLSFSSSLFYFRFGLFALGVYILLDNFKFIKKYLLYSIFLLFSFLIIDSYIQLIYGYNIYGNPIFQNNRVTSIFGDEIKLGSFISRLSPLYFGLILLLLKDKNFLLNLFLFIYFISISVIFFTGERVAFAYILISLTLLFLNNLNDFKISKIFLIYFFISLIVIVISSSIYPFLFERMIQLTMIQMNIFDSLISNSNYDITSDKKFIIFSIPHEQHYFTAFKIFLDHPLFGAGPKMFRELCFYEIYNSGVHSCSTHPHNSFVQLLSEAGVIGFTTLFLILIFISFKIISILYFQFKNKKNNSYKFSLYVCIFISIFPFVPNGSFFNNWLSVIYYLPIGFLLHDYFKGNQI